MADTRSADPVTPRPIDARGPRFGAAVTTVVLAFVLILMPQTTVALTLLVVQAVVFALGAAGRSPYALFFAKVVRPRLGPPTESEDPRPPRFAQGVGLVFALVAILGLVLGSVMTAVLATAAALVAAFLNAAFAYCLGCEMYIRLQRLRPAA